MGTRRLYLTLTGSLVVFVLALTAIPALADGVYHSQHIALVPVGDSPLRSGFVENIHTNGPQIFALERYVLLGAAPSTEYQVTIQIYGDPDATASLGAMPTIAFRTNGVGNGVGRFTLPLSGVPEAFHGLTIYLVWELTTSGAVAYKTPVSKVVLD